MGASLDARTYDLDLGMDKIKSRWNESVESSLYEDGNSYSGGIGMLGKGFSMVSRVAKDARDAYEFIAENHDKWDGAMGVKSEDGKITIGGWCSS